MGHLQTIADRYARQGLTVLGLNASDARDIALEELRRQNVRFTNIIDSSPAAEKTVHQDYRCSGVPLSYVIDRQGKIIDGWYGGTDDNRRTLKALRQGGITIQPPDTLPADEADPASQPADTAGPASRPAS